MSERTVYRVQDAEGRGPWRPGFSEQWLDDSRSDADYAALPPWPMEFGPVHQRAVYGMHLGCGCASMFQLRRWFTPLEYRRLLAFRYQAVRMRVGRVLAESPVQCVFERAKPLAVDVEPFELYPSVAAVDPADGDSNGRPRATKDSDFGLQKGEQP